MASVTETRQRFIAHHNKSRLLFAILTGRNACNSMTMSAPTEGKCPRSRGTKHTVNGKIIFAELDWDDLPYERGERYDLYDRFIESENWNIAARQIFSDCRLQFFIALREESPQTRIRRYIPTEDYFRTGTYPADAWCLRDAFLKVPPHGPNVLSFLNKWGRWTHTDYTQLHQILGFQKRIRRALVSRPDEWLSRSSLWASGMRSAYPNFTIRTYSCESAISETVTLDLLRKVTFKTCARPDCHQPFQITSRHKREYCCQYCAHLESLRRSRRDGQQ